MGKTVPELKGPNQEKAGVHGRTSDNASGFRGDVRQVVRFSIECLRIAIRARGLQEVGVLQQH